MKARNFIVTACLGTAICICICIFCSSIANAQPAREFHDGFRGKNRQGEFRKNIHEDFARQIEKAYERGFKDGVNASKNLVKEKRGGERKFNRNEKYAGKYNPKKNFRNAFKYGAEERFHAHHKQNSEHAKHYAKQNDNKTQYGRFVPKGFHHEGFAQVPPKNIRHNEFDRGAKNNFRKGEFKQPPFGKQHGELARKQEGKKYFDAPDKPKQKHNKKDVNKKEDRSKSSKPHLPLGDRS